MRRIWLLGLGLHAFVWVSHASAQFNGSGSSGFGGGGSSSNFGGGSSGLGAGGGGLGGGAGGGSFNNPTSSGGFGLGFMTLGQRAGSSRGGNTAGASSFLGPYYASPLALGYGPLNSGSAAVANANSNPTFGAVFANTATSGTGGAAGGRGGAGGQAGSASNLTGSVDFMPMNSAGLRRNLPYAAEVTFEERPANSDTMAALAEQRLIGNVMEILARTSRIPSASGVSLSVDQGVLILSGTVQTDKEKRVLEAMVRMTPGVRDLRNDVRTSP